MASVVVAVLVTLLCSVAAAAAVVVPLSRRLSLTRRRLEDTVAARDALMARERDLAIHASHELRTPITALRLSLEDMAQWPQTSPEVAQELEQAVAEVDRWDRAVEDVLGRAHGHRLATARSTDLTALTAQVCSRYVEQAAPRRLAHRANGPVLAQVDPTTVEDVLTHLLDHLLQHGSGPVRVGAEHHPGHLRVHVADTSQRTLPSGVIRPGVVGLEDCSLTEAGSLAESLGGYLAVEDRSTTRFVLLLPAPAATAEL